MTDTATDTPVDAPEMDWLPGGSEDPNQRQHPSESDLRDALVNAPEAPRKSTEQPKSKGKDDEQQHKPDDTARGEGGDSQGHDYSERAGEQGRGGGGARGRKSGEIYDGCPVTPLGVFDGASYYLDTWGQLRRLTKHDIQAIKVLFGKDIPVLWDKFPQWKIEDDVRSKVPEKFNQDKASNAMIMASSELGPFNSENAVRGVGAWKTEDGDLVYHMGNELLIAGKIHKPGKHGRHIYPAYPAIPTPAPPEGRAESPVPEFKRVLSTWNWQRPELDPMIAIGLTGVQMLGGALDWRPVFWGTGGAGSGKSELQKLINMMHGPDGVISSEDPTKSGITSRLGHSSLPVSLDEREPDTDARSSKNSDIIALARIASSGGDWIRGSSDGTGSSGKVFSAFLFSSILIPGTMKPQDVQRLIQLNLNRLPVDAKPLNLVPSEWRARGAVFKRNLIDRWPTFTERMALWRTALGEAGVQGRDADNWGVVIAMADMAEHEKLPSQDDMDYWTRLIAEAHTVGRADIQDDAAAMLLHLKTQVLDINRRGDNYSVAQWIMVAGGLPSAPESLLAYGTNDPMADDRKRRRAKANETLARVGLRVTGVREEAVLFIANAKISGLNDLFRNTDWAGGSWKQSALRIDGAQTSTRAKTLQGTSTRGVDIPIKSISGMMVFPNSRTGPDPAANPQNDPSIRDDLI